MQTLGQQLRAEREKKGLSIAELAGQTRIRAAYFEAIEADQPEQFPGRFFYRSFLRQYASLLELPEAVVRAAIEQSLAEEQAEARERQVVVQQDFRPEVPPMPTGRINVREETRRWLIRLSGLVGVLVLCSAVYFSWQRWGQRLLDEGWRSVAAHHERAAAPPSQTVAQQPATQPSAVPPAANPAATSPASSESAPATPPGQAVATAQPGGMAATPVDAPPPGVKAHGSIELHASGDSWVSGWRDGKQFLAITLRAGETRIVEGGGVIRLQFGSAGDVTITVNGQALPPIGAKGEIRGFEYHDGAYRLLDRGRPAEPKQ